MSTPTMTSAAVAMDAAIAPTPGTPRLRRQASLVTSRSTDAAIPGKPAISNATPVKARPITLGKNMASRWLPFMSEWDWRATAIVTALALVVRLAFLQNPSVVVFDEVHFGGFAAKYLRGEYFGDVHPPLARLLVTLSAWVGGFKGDFNFYDIGADYIKAKAPHVVMRSFTGTLGALVAPIAYLTLRSLSVSSMVSLTGSLFILFDNALTTQSRLILLDSYLVFFTATTAMFWLFFNAEKHAPFKAKWWVWLFLTGVSLGLVASCKWVGLFVVAAVGLYTISDLWRTFGDTSVPLVDVGKHFAARAAALIAVPFSIYAFTFYLHFALLKNHSIAASGMSVAFQQTLNGGELPPAFRDVYYGSQVSIRQFRAEGGYLHSHQHLYPEGSKQQQVTTYHHRDDNNLFILRRPFVVNVTYKDGADKDEQEETTPLKHGDLFRFEHIYTGRFLHSHPVQPPIADKDHNFEVSGYGHHKSKFSDLNDNWRIENVNEKGEPVGQVGDPIHAMSGKVRFVHANLGCVLNAANRILPEWGFKQGEVTCGRETLKINSIWFFETNEHAKVSESTPKVTFPKSGFWANFVELNVKMWVTNKGLSADHPFASRPGSWPLLSRGLGFWNGNHVPKTEEEHKRQKEREARQGINDPNYQASPKTDEEKKEEKRLRDYYRKFRSAQIYLLGNPLVWFGSTVSLVIFAALVLVNRAAEHRGLTAFTSPLYKAQSPAGFLFMAWLLHWLPFFAMQRQLFLHHYLPALYLAVLLACVQLNHGLYVLSGRFPRLQRFQWAICAALVAVTVGLFLVYAPLGYGLRMTRSYCRRLKLLPRWDFDCDSLVESLADVKV